MVKSTAGKRYREVHRVRARRGDQAIRRHDSHVQCCYCGCSFYTACRPPLSCIISHPRRFGDLDRINNILFWIRLTNRRALATMYGSFHHYSTAFIHLRRWSIKWVIHPCCFITILKDLPSLNPAMHDTHKFTFLHFFFTSRFFPFHSQVNCTLYCSAMLGCWHPFPVAYLRTIFIKTSA